MNIKQLKNHSHSELIINSESNQEDYQKLKTTRVKKKFNLGVFLQKSFVITSFISLLIFFIGNQVTKKIQRGENVKQYLDFMSQLINEQELYTQNPQDAKASAKHQQAKNVARGLTLNILNRLNDWDDYVVKGQVINFLYESHLIGYYQQQDNNLTQAIISLKYANLKKTEINLSNGLLDGINLEGTSLQNTNLSEMTLRYTNFSNAHLEYAKLNTSDLSNANLQQAFLQNADLSNAFLTGANLQNAQLCGTKLINVRDSETANFKDAIYDDTTEFGNILNSEAGRKMQSKMKKGICNPVS